MTPALFWVAVVIGALVTFPIGWRLGYRAGERDYSELPTGSWDEHVDQALSVFSQRAEQVTPTEWAGVERRARSNLSYLSSRRDKIT